MDKKYKDLQFYKFCAYGFLKNLRFFEPFLVLFFLEKGLNFFQIGTLYSIMKIATNILEIPTGIIADSVGRRRSMVFSFSSYIISFIIFYFSKSYTIFAFAMILYAFGEAFRTGTHKAMIFEYLKIKGWEKMKVHYYGNTRSCSQLGSAISSLIAGGIVFYSGKYQTIFLFTIIPYIFDLILMLTYPKELDGTLERFDFKEFTNSFKKVIKEFAVAFKSARLFGSILISSSYTGYYSAVKDFLQPMLKSFAISLPIFMSLSEDKRSSLVIGIVYSVIYFLTSFVSRRSGKFAEKFKTYLKPLVLTMSLGFVFGILSGITYEFKLFTISIIFYLGIYLIENLRKPISVAYISNNIDNNILASVLSVESQFKTLLTAILTPVIGYLADLIGIGYALSIVSIGLIVLTLISLKFAAHNEI
ncbi:Major Facilitator Superfamily transporter [Marinitoga piezophila KA3]|uniref:Major Facilitator Superfamily transporter n=1 Tax=Marinitoga piezophila (strain DSM 14283 / JCM 11233 / KA3) TaxID=443254 RepID=H2J620_MARPK|nr:MULTISPECIES: MFS transporter [Marinitoga]AEX85081.1 Major Facilitator Superfamily transporter [Marinitoga piezophila KA3]NUU97230.1 MFS transporter [Marinitoga sp. 1138]